MTLKRTIVRIAFIGSRKTPAPILDTVTRLCCELACDPNNRWLCSYSSIRSLPPGIVIHGYSGGAEGFDSAAELGYKQAGFWENGFKAFLPIQGYRGNKSPYFGVSEKAIEIFRRYHPAPEKVSGFAENLLARDSYQILDETLDNPVDAVVCWTPDGKASGGTGQALRIAADHNIDIFNLYHADALQKFSYWLWRLQG